MSDITNRLRELAHAVADQRWSEFSMRVPADHDRDADLVLVRAADEITQLRAKLDAMTAERNGLQIALNDARSDMAAALSLVADVRAAIGDDGRRMQPELIEYCKAMKRDAAAAPELVEALRTARDYVFSELETERQQMKGYERISRIDEIAADLAEIDAALAKAGVK